VDVDVLDDVTHCRSVPVAAGTGPVCPLHASSVVGFVVPDSYMPYMPRPSSMMATSSECAVDVDKGELVYSHASVTWLW